MDKYDKEGFERWVRDDERRKIIKKLREEADKSQHPLVYPIISKYIDIVEDEVE